MGVIMYKGQQYGNQLDISGKVDKITGKGLSSNDYTDAEKLKLSTIAEGAQINTVTGVKGESEVDYRAGNINITKTNIGLGNVDNTSDVDKPISTATQAALNDKISTSLKGATSGVAELDENGKVPTSQLPSFVDDVVEYSSLANFPLTGETGKIYIDTFTNLSYRWSGNNYVEISPSLALGETSATAYRGDRGKEAYDHAQAKGSAFSNGLYKITTNSEGHVTETTAVTKADITGLGIPESDTTYSSKNASQNGTDVSLVTTGEKYVWNNKVDAVSGKGLSTEDYTTAEKAKLNGIEASAQVNSITGVKGDAESAYRTGNVNLTAADIGAVPTNLTTIADCDDNTLAGVGEQIHFYRIDTNTLNSPYKQGLSVSTVYTLVIIGSNNFTTQIAYEAGSPRFYMRSKGGSGSEWNGAAWTPNITGIKGNSESAYRTGNVNLTPANIGAMPASGGIFTGNVHRKAENVDITKADNNISSTLYPGLIDIIDSNAKQFGRIECGIFPNGNISMNLNIQNYDTDGAVVGRKGLQMEMDKAGVLKYTVSDADKFRSAINVDAAPCLSVNCGTLSSLPTTISNAAITENMVVVSANLSNPSAQAADDWQAVCSNGSITVSGTISGTTTLTLYLMKSKT